MEGWNDPMDLSKFEPTGKLKINLNKRVAFPMGQQATSEMPSSQEPLRALPTVLFGIHENQNTSKSDDESKMFDSQAAKIRVCSTLQDKCIENLSPSIQANVKGKLKSLEDEWDTCDTDLQKLLVELIEYIEQKDPKNAGGVQRKIIMKGYNKPWMQGIRQIIFSLESMSPQDNDNTEA